MKGYAPCSAALPLRVDIERHSKEVADEMLRPVQRSAACKMIRSLEITSTAQVNIDDCDEVHAFSMSMTQ